MLLLCWNPVACWPDVSWAIAAAGSCVAVQDSNGYGGVQRGAAPLRFFSSPRLGARGLTQSFGATDKEIDLAGLPALQSWSR
jgi:phage protein U